MSGNYTVNGKAVSLTQSDFKAAGGEANIFVKNHSAYKIYHDAAKMIPVGKIQELSILKNIPNILGPQEVMYKGNNPVGFMMTYMANTEYLCKLFTKGFRDKNAIDSNIINNLVKVIQKTVKQVHTNKILLVDANPFNFLTNSKFNDVYFVDVDSYQTPSYPATALMESVRDRQVKNKHFTELSDWFSVACVLFELYIGCHPYKGRHPDFAAKDWAIMMDKGISVFNKKCKLPPACQDFSSIPKGHLRWFESIFEKGDRTIPPEPDAIAPSGPVVTKIIQGNDKFKIELVRSYDGKIKALRFIDGLCWVITDKSIWADGKEFITYSYADESGHISQRVHDLVPTQGDNPVWLEWNKIEGSLKYSTIKSNNLYSRIGRIESNGFFVSNRCAYTVVRDSLVELSFINTGVKTNAMQQVVANIFHNHKVYDGLVIQNMLDTCRFAIPYESGKCAIVRVTELDKCRIVDARYESGVCVVMAERNGKYERHVLIFNKDCTSYNIRIEKNADLQDINFAIKDNGVCVSSIGDNLEVFLDNTKVKQLSSPLNNNETLVAYKNDIYVINGKELHKIQSK